MNFRKKYLRVNAPYYYLNFEDAAGFSTYHFMPFAPLY
jgi:hypothetical protein